jgi:hypothetical protein
MISTARGFKYDLRGTIYEMSEGSKLGSRVVAFSHFQLSHLRFLTSNFSFLI